ncbi:MAG TPA: AMP-binding protein [Candidatus Polarisedimenticolia bacterium]|nr:AMP-binding protein [Candidatus Polarisedimenticolia bacterium]
MSDTQGTMAHQSVLDYFKPDSRPSDEIAVVWRRGYRTLRWSYADLLRTAMQFALELKARGIAKGDRVLLWGENSGEWVAAFLGCLLRGAVAVPMDAIAGIDFAARVAAQADVRIAMVGRGLPSLGGKPTALCLEDLHEIVRGRPAEGFSPAPAQRGDLVEVVFTSGTTAEPRGVVLTHGNLLANLEPLEREIARYRRYEHIFHPLRFLDLLPLSHVFGQLLGIFLPQILGGTTVFLDTLNPAEVIGAIRSERVSVLVTVPRLIESLRDQIGRDLAASGRLEKFQRDYRASEGEHFLRRWWRFRAIHRRLGWKFWAVISGGASLPADAEQFWSRLGYAVIQGYGLTETTSLVTVNHPFRLGRRSIGKVLPGLEVKLAADGEILVRGENVASGYWKNSGIAPVLDADGWFHTGDLGERDAQGNLYFKGRRKNVIVTPEGLNVYPEDLEAELRREPGVRDCVVVGVERDGNAEPCAVLLLRQPLAAGETAESTAAVAQGIVERANQHLAPFQQMRRWLVWSETDFPRTPTQKPVLARIREAVETELGSRKAPGGPVVGPSGPLAELLARIARGRSAPKSGTEPIHLSSIERVELLSALEDRYQVDLSETEFAAADTVLELERLVEERSPRAAVFHYPRWAQARLVRIVRAAVYHLLARPAMLLLGWPSVRGREKLRGTTGPVLVVTNHIAYFDPVFVLVALPPRLRRRLAVAMDGELLESMRTPPAGTGFLTALAHRAAYWLVVSLFNVFPLPRQAGFRKSFAFAGDLVDRGWSVLVFPEGARTRGGGMGPFRSGIGLLATRLGVPVVPMRLGGIFELKQAGKRRARRGEIKVSVGPPARFGEADAAETVARELERRVTELGEDF